MAGPFVLQCTSIFTLAGEALMLYSILRPCYRVPMVTVHISFYL